MTRMSNRSLLLLIILISQTFTYPAPYIASGYKILSWQNDFAILQYKLPDNSSVPIAISTSQNGTIWVLEQATNKLVAFNPQSKRFSVFPIPTPNSFPISLAVNGNGVWFTELNGEKLGYLNLSTDNIIEYSIPGINVSVSGLKQKIPCGPTFITFDSLSNVWLACVFSNQIVKFNMQQNNFTAYSLPVFQSGIAGLLFNDSRLWFSAADANMIGYAELNAVVPNTKEGIVEFPPINESYVYSFSHPTSFLGQYENLSSSLPTPTSMALGSNADLLWITEHVDDSFDSYNPVTKTLDKYWLSKTNSTFGYTYDFPNYIQPDSSANLWIAEHYGNKIGIFLPSQMTLLELKIPCCTNDIAGAYTGTLDASGNFWFVETNAGAIGEVTRTGNSVTLNAEIESMNVVIANGDIVKIPISYHLSSLTPMNLSFDISGITPDGQLINLTAQFNQTRIQLLPGSEASILLTLHDKGLKPGKYFLTMSAISAESVYSFVIALQVGNMSLFNFTFSILLALVLTLLAILSVYVALRMRNRRNIG